VPRLPATYAVLVRELGSRERSQPPPPHVLWESLVAPAQAGSRVWLKIRSGERRPRVVESREHDLVVWSSIWVSRPRDRIRFDIAPDGGSGSLLRWTWLTRDAEPDEEELSRLRHRMNELINAELRYSFGQ
jgi:hypothetical protein